MFFLWIWSALITVSHRQRCTLSQEWEHTKFFVAACCTLLPCLCLCSFHPFCNLEGRQCLGSLAVSPSATCCNAEETYSFTWDNENRSFTMRSNQLLWISRCFIFRSCLGVKSVHSEISCGTRDIPEQKKGTPSLLQPETFNWIEVRFDTV